MLAIIEIFGGRAAMSEEFSGMTYADIMDDIFARSKSFSGKEYYDEMVRICPELKKKWWERIPSEEQVKKMVADWYSFAAIDGKESIPAVSYTHLGRAR